jgi:rhodanese-related sulfurtransferase
MHRLWDGLNVGAILAAILLAACNTGISDKSLRYINPDEAITLAAGRDSLLGIGGVAAGVYIDPRPQADFDAERIPGAVHLPFDRVHHDHRDLIDYGALIVYGSDYNDSLALAMSKRLIELGHKEVHTLRGGLRAWKAAGNKVETGEGG